MHSLLSSCLGRLNILITGSKSWSLPSCNMQLSSGKNSCKLSGSKSYPYPNKDFQLQLCNFNEDKNHLHQFDTLEIRHIYYALHIFQTVVSFHFKNSQSDVWLRWFFMVSKLSLYITILNDKPLAHKHKTIFCTMYETYENFKNLDCSDSYMYYIFCPFNRHGYIGETKNIVRRFKKDHIPLSLKKKRASTKEYSSLYNIWNKNGPSCFSVVFFPIPSSIRKQFEKRWVGHFSPSMNTTYIHEDKSSKSYPKANLGSSNPSTKMHRVIALRNTHCPEHPKSDEHGLYMLRDFNPLYKSFLYPTFFSKLSSVSVFQIEGSVLFF